MAEKRTKRPAQASIDFAARTAATKATGEGAGSSTGGAPVLPKTDVVALQEYAAVDGEMMRVNRFDLLAGDIGVGSGSAGQFIISDLPKFQAVISESLRSW